MVVLSRKRRESVVVGGHNPLEQLLKVTVLDIRAGEVKLGFEAGIDVAVDRWEAWLGTGADQAEALEALR